MAYFVSRQDYWGQEPDDRYTVEIASGGIDYANPDMLATKYRPQGEGQEYTDPREAAEAAIKVAEAWKKDAPELTINIAHGFTGGCTMPFEGDTVENIRKWAEEAYEKLEKCARCGDVLPEPRKRFKLCEPYGDDGEFCSSNCAEMFQQQNFDEDFTE